MAYLQTVFYLAVVLGIMVLVHEFGHFAVAKLCGVRVETFSIGMGKRIFGIRRGGTDYRLSLLPIGGYVKMSGDNPGEAPTDPGDFNAHPRWQRILIALAGPIANFILAFVIIVFVSMFHHEIEQYLTRPATIDYVTNGTIAARLGIHSGDTIVHFDTVENPNWEQVGERAAQNSNNQTVPISWTHNGVRTDGQILVKSNDTGDAPSFDAIGLVPRLQDTPIEVLSVMNGTPAQQAGLQAHDQLAAIDGVAMHSVPALLAYMQDAAGKPAVLTVLRNGNTLNIPITPQMSDSGTGAKLYLLGFHPVQPPVDVDRQPFGQAVVTSLKTNKHDSMMIIEVLQNMFKRKISVKSLSGPIGIGQQISETVQMGWWNVPHLMSSISLNLGIFNLLPIPILDGGMILFLLIETIIRRDVNIEIKERIYQAAFVVILLFAAFVIFNDISKTALFSHLKT